MSYTADPGGNFASDAHRRVMAHLPNPGDDPLSVEDLIAGRVNNDPHTLGHFEQASEVEDVLKDLEADGYAKATKKGWRNTQSGFDVLTGPPSETATGASGDLGLDPATPNTNGDG